MSVKRESIKVEVPEKIIPAHTKEDIKETYFCDICLEQMVRYRTCAYCKQEICDKCIVYDPDDNSDYPNKWCKDCEWVRQQLLPRKKELEAELDKLEDEWGNKCKENAKNKLFKTS